MVMDAKGHDSRVGMVLTPTKSDATSVTINHFVRKEREDDRTI